MNQIKENLRKNFKSVGIFLLFLLAISITYTLVNHFKRNSFNNYAAFQTTLLEKEKRSTQLMNEIIEKRKNSDSSSFLNTPETTLSNQAKENNIVIFVEDTTKEAPIYWTEHTQDIPYSRGLYVSSKLKFQVFKNNCYVYKTQKYKDIIITSFILIKDLYPSQSQFFPQKFPDEYHVPDNSRVTLKYEDGAKQIVDHAGNLLFYFIPDTHSIESISNTQLVIYGITYYALLLFLILIVQCVDIRYGRHYYLLISVVLSVGLSLLFLYLPQTLPIYAHILFSPRLFALHGWLPSLGHLIIYTSNLIFFVCSITLVLWRKKNTSAITLILVYIFNALIFVLFITLLQALCNNSSLALDFKYVSFYDYKIYLYYFIIALYVLALCVFSFLNAALSFKLSKSQKIIYTLGSVFVGFILSYFIFHFPWWTFIFHLLLMLIIHTILKEPTNNTLFNIRLRMAVVMVVFLSLFTNTMIYELHLQVVQDFVQTKMTNMNVMIPNNDDHETHSSDKKNTNNSNDWSEFLLEGISDQINSVLAKNTDLTHSSDIEALKNKIDEYFSTTDWRKYKVEILLCTPSDVSMHLNKKEVGNVEFNTIITEKSVKIEDSNFYIINDSIKISEYVGIFDMPKNKKHYKCYVHIFTDQQEIESDGYSSIFNSLLVQNSIGKQFSYARYDSSRLVLSSGIFIYNERDEWIKTLKKNSKSPDKNYFISGNYEHWIYSPQSNQYLVISFPVGASNPFFLLTTFSTLLFSLLGVLILIATLKLKIVQIRKSFAIRVSVWFMSLFFLCMTVLAYFILHFILNQYRSNDNELLMQKANRIENVLLTKLQNNDNLLSDPNSKMDINRMADEFGVDVNIFNKEGVLIHSSQPTIFKRGLRSEFMNNNARLRLSSNVDQKLLVKEEIGSLEFFSFYSSVYNNKGILLGYFNIPYFYSYSKLNLSIYNLLAGIANIYLLIILIMSFIITGISRRLTRPLTQIQDNIKDLRINDKNEQIDYNGKDEIGELIDEYNHMLITIQDQAKILAESEREMAWRTMARQIAHEIKNPLTPMKLKLQQLLHLKNSESPKFNDYFNQSTPALIDQIDSLALIADEFSNFAKISDQKEDIPIELIAAIKQFMILYKDNPEIEIQFNYAPYTEIWCVFNLGMARQVFNNIITNAYQARKENTICKEIITFHIEGDSIIISATNNGEKIPKEIQNKIFNPNFTTKSNGNGLGLPISKRIIDQRGGSIWVETSEEQTTFYIKAKCSKYKCNE